MFAPLGSGDKSLGCVIMGRRRGVETYGAADLEQLDVLTDVARAALSGLGGDIDRTCEAVKMLLLIRRRGIPTATAEALDLVRKLAGRLGLRSRETRGLLYAATLHDAGMARVEDEIVLGEADLSYDERDEVNRHVERGLDLMGPLIPDQATRRIILHHHERFDGSGYPVGLEGTEIPLGSRVLAVVDAWCSLTTARPFRSGLTPEAALAELRKFAGTQFDPSIVTEFAGLLHDEKIVNETSPTQVLSGPDLEETT
jgi:HD-GYP domain-containing protein (c-di-GMP phosphodiesterase class II)